MKKSNTKWLTKQKKTVSLHHQKRNNATQLKH